MGGGVIPLPQLTSRWGSSCIFFHVWGIAARMWMDNQGYLKDSLRRRLFLRLNWTRIVFHGCYHGYVLHHLQWIIGLAPSRSLLHVRVHMIGSLRLTNSMLPSAFLLSSIKRHKSFSNFLSIVGFFLFLLLLSLFKIDSDFDLSCNSFHMIYFIFSCIAILILLFFLEHFIFLRDRYTRYVQRRCKQDMYRKWEECCYLLVEEVSSILLSLLCRFLLFGNWCFMFLFPFL